MGQRAKPEELREMLKVARKLRAAACTSDDNAYTALFERAAAALEDRAQQLAFDPADLELVDDFEEVAADPSLYRPVDFRC